MSPPSDFLDTMGAGSRERARATLADSPLATWRRRAAEHTPAPPLALSPAGFDLVAEVKFTSPAEGTLGPASPEAALVRARDYARAGAAAVSILTEPTRFGGALEHLGAAADLDVPVLRKDFLVDPVQVFEARAAGAGGVLVIARLLEDGPLDELLAAARECGLFVLLEAFDAADLDRVLPRTTAADDTAPVLPGLNSRDLVTLRVAAGRLVELAPRLAPHGRAVAESGLLDAAAVAEVATAGYGLALVGTALMRAPDPAAELTRLLLAGRRARREEVAR